MINSREIKVRLLKDVGNKAKGTVKYFKANRANKLISRDLAIPAKEDEPEKTIFTKEAAKNFKEGKKVVRVRSIGENKSK
jgi:hypothetical protein